MHRSTLFLAVAFACPAACQEPPPAPEINAATAMSPFGSMGTLVATEKPGKDVAVHFFGLGELDISDFPIGLGWPDMGYALRLRESGDLICRGVNYYKTFGGAFGGITVHLIADRFVAYPETVAKVPGAPIFNDHMAVTHVYDLEKKKCVHTSKRYRYNHDIHPLFYEKAAIPGYRASP